MAPPNPPEKITLKIKVPPGYIQGGSDEYSLGSLAVSTNIGTVRQQIQQTVPSNPTPERQRLLYGGRALVDDEQTLADALNTRRDVQQTEYVVHLLIKRDGVGQQMQQHVPQMQPQVGPAFVPPGFQLPPGARAMPPDFAQQQRAGMGMHGVAPPQQPQPNGAAPPPEPQAPSGSNGTPAQGTQGLEPQTANGRALTPQPSQPPLPGARRPVSAQGFLFEGIGPNGQRVQIHQQTLQIPVLQVPWQQPIFDVPPMPPGLALPPPGLFGLPAQQPGINTSGTAPHRAGYGMPEVRRGLDEVRRELDEVRQSGVITEVFRNRIASLQEQLQISDDYLDPVGPGARPSAAAYAEGAQQQGGDQNGAQAESQREPGSRAGTHPEARPSSPFSNTHTGGQDSLSGSHPAQGASRFGNPHQQGASLGNTQPQANLFGNPQAPQSLFGHMPATSLVGQPRLPFGNAQPLQWQSTNPDTVSCFLLSGPGGPHALLFSPPHGQYFGQVALQPTLTTTAAQAGPATSGPRQPGQQLVQIGHQAAAQAGVAGHPVAAAAVQAIGGGNAQNAAQAGNQQNAAAQQDPLRPFQPFLNHIWLLLRVLIFAYFLLGSNMGWRRPVALLVIGLGFWIVRAGLFGEGGVLRRWWEDVMRIDGAQRPGQQGQAQQQGQTGGEQQQPQQQQGQGQGQGAGRRQQMPTPEQLSQRLLNEQTQRRNARLEQIRQYIRPLERAVALFVASLWPGIGEAHVRAQEAEERRRNEEEIAARRREEEARQKAAEGSAEGEKKEEKAEGVAAGSSERAANSEEPAVQGESASAA